MRKILIAIIAASAIGCGEEEEASLPPVQPDPNFGKIVDVQIPPECGNVEKVISEYNTETIYCRDDEGILTVYRKLMNLDVWTGRRYIHESIHQQ